MKVLCLVFIFLFLSFGCGKTENEIFNKYPQSKKGITKKAVKFYKKQSKKGIASKLNKPNKKKIIKRKKFIYSFKMRKVKALVTAFFILPITYKISYPINYEACYAYSCVTHYDKRFLTSIFNLALLRVQDLETSKYFNLILLKNVEVYSIGETLNITFNELKNEEVWLANLLPNYSWLENIKIKAKGVVVKID